MTTWVQSLGVCAAARLIRYFTWCSFQHQHQHQTNYEASYQYVTCPLHTTYLPFVETVRNWRIFTTFQSFHMRGTYINASVKNVFAASFRYEGEIKMALKILGNCPG